LCGLSGVVLLDANTDLASRFSALSRTWLTRRGPDGFNVETVAPGVTFTHARLSIIDLEGGRQPMSSDRGVMVFNGEIYNYQDLMDPAQVYQTHSDTEVLLRGLQRKGLSFLNDADGMFAFGHLDHATRKLTLARDLMGIKPLYYIKTSRAFAFASRMQPLMMFSKAEIDPQAFLEYQLGRACRAPRTIFADVREVCPGEAIVIDIDTLEMDVRRWAEPLQTPRDLDNEDEALAALDSAMNLAVDRHLIADVPVATFLSGGVDSSLITALVAKRNPEVAAFSIGFHDPAFDESGYAAAVCRQYNLRHHVRFCDASDFLGLIENWPQVMDDAVADPSAVMLYTVAQFARDLGYKVVLSGDGADELFGGYNQYRRFQLASRIAPYGRHAPFLIDLVKRARKGQSRYEHFARQATVDNRYYGTGMIFEPHLLRQMLGKSELPVDTATNLTEALSLDLARRLPDDMLTRTDRATMHASIEARVPFVTPYMQAIAGRLSERMLINGKTQKYLLKKLSERYVPRQCIYRRKVGFDLPLKHWWRGPLREKAEALRTSSWQSEFFLDNSIAQVVNDHMSGAHDNADKIWALWLLENNVNHLRSIANEKVTPLVASELV
jgi:asparagine synthase (glutamine-hydrolysing)